jgi:phospholipase/lecithinase/hemolysin
MAKQNNQLQWVAFLSMIQQTFSTQMRSQPTNGLYYERPIANTIEAARLLHQHGVNRYHIIVMGLPNMTLTPYLRSGLKNHSGLRQIIQVMSRLYNWQLRRHVSQYASFYSVYTLLNDIVGKKNQFIYHSVSCIEKKELPLCQGFIFYDHKHITVAAGQVLADRVYVFLK